MSSIPSGLLLPLLLVFPLVILYRFPAIVNLMLGLDQVFPPKPRFTEKDLPSLEGKVCIVTGGNSGLGREVAQILYGKHATVWLAARNDQSASEAIAAIKKQHPDSKGTIRHLKLDLADLTTIRKSAETFLAAENRLDLLINNAGVMFPPPGSKTKQGYEIQLGTNCVGPFLFTKLLTPLLETTAKTAPKDSVRVVWVSSQLIEFSPKGGVELDNLDYHRPLNLYATYGVSKAGNWLHNAEFARQVKTDGVLSVCLNPGGLRTNLTRTSPWFVSLAANIGGHPAIHGAYTEIYAALSPDISLQNTGAWVIPFGRLSTIRKDLQQAAVPESEGGTGIARKFWAWSEEQIRPYL